VYSFTRFSLDSNVHGEDHRRVKKRGSLTSRGRNQNKVPASPETGYHIREPSSHLPEINGTRYQRVIVLSIPDWARLRSLRSSQMRVSRLKRRPGLLSSSSKLMFIISWREAAFPFCNAVFGIRADVSLDKKSRNSFCWRANRRGRGKNCCWVIHSLRLKFSK